MPTGGISMAIIAGWLLPKQVTLAEMQLKSQWQFILWRFLVRFVAPAISMVMFWYNLCCFHCRFNKAKLRVRRPATTGAMTEMNSHNMVKQKINFSSVAVVCNSSLTKLIQH
jgi:hypothetical protein